MARYRINRRAALGLCAGALLAPVAARALPSPSRDKIRFLTNWRAQAELGGFYYALANGIYDRLGLDVDLRSGGPQINPAQMLLAGNVDVIVSNSFEAIRYVEEDLPFLCVAAIFQKDPQVLICHPNAGRDRLEQLKGAPILVGGQGRSSYWPFLKAKFGFSDEQIRPYTFNPAPFLADKAMCQQGFVSSEPYTVEKEGGITPVVHLIADAGFDTYSTTLNVARSFALGAQTDTLRRFVTASILGWSEYMKGGEGNKAANALIRTHNPDMPPDLMAYALKTMQSYGIVQSGDALKLGIGAMSDARWSRFYTQMRDAGLFKPNLDVKRAYTLDFVNAGLGL